MIHGVVVEFVLEDVQTFRTVFLVNELLNGL